jgi:small GTP-binding protein
MESQDFSLGMNLDDSDIRDKTKSLSYNYIHSNNDIVEFKIILIGSVSVGKTSIFNKFIIGEFSQTYKSTITVECKSKYLKIDKNLFAKLNIWDTCGAEIFRAVTKQYYRGADAAIVIFDLTEQNTFNDLKKWLKDIKNCGDKNIQILIVGNKLDLVGKRKVTQSQAMNFCKDNGYKYIEASAKDGTNVLRIFEEVTSDLANRHQKQKEKEINEKYKMKTLEIMDNNVEEKNKKGCC